MRFSHEIGGSDIDSVIAEAVEAEKLHYDLLWIPDHLVDVQPVYAIYDAWTLLSFIGARTKTIKLGSGVTDVQRIHPAKLANIVSTLDHLTRGRAILGIGTGEIMNTKPFGIPWEERETRIEKLRESVTLIKLLWSSSYKKPVSWSGKYYSLDEAHLSLPPFRKNGTPVYIGAFSSAKLLQTVGEMADGWYPGSMNTVEAFKQKVEKIRIAARRARRRASSIDIIASIPTIVCTKATIDKTRKQIKTAMKREMLFNHYLFRALRVNSNNIGITDIRKLNYQFAAPSEKFDAELNEAVSKISVPEEILDSGIDRMMAVGSPDDCVSSIERFIRAGATHIFFPSLLASRRNYRLIGEKIIPLLR